MTPRHRAAASHTPPSPARPNGIENNAIGNAEPDDLALPVAAETAGIGGALVDFMLAPLSIDCRTTISAVTPATNQ